jgi:transcription termination/antitermination protein NusA
MKSINLVDSFAELKDAEGIDRPTLINVIKEVFKNILKKRYGSDDNFEVIVNDATGDLEIFHNRVIVDNDDVYNTLEEIELHVAQKEDDSLEVGDEFSEAVDLLETFGRRYILNIKQQMKGKFEELKRNALTKTYSEKIGNIISGEVYQIWKKEILLLDEEGNELILPKTEQIPTDFFKKGESVRAVVKSVDIRNNTPLIMLSRTAPSFLEKLLENEVPEINDGLIKIVKIVREPGERAKVAVESFSDRIDPVGACVGMKGSRIHGIVRELRNENIDVINFTTNIQLLLQRSLTPAKITSMKIDVDNKYAEITMKPDQVSLAIGKKGVNIKLAQELTEFEIGVYRDDIEDQVYDIDLNEFSDEIDQWIIDSLKEIGCDTARSVLNLNEEELARRADLEVETARDVLKVLAAEFEDEG